MRIDMYGEPGRFLRPDPAFIPGSDNKCVITRSKIGILHAAVGSIGPVRIITSQEPVAVSKISLRPKTYPHEIYAHSTLAIAKAVSIPKCRIAVIYLY